MSEVLIDTEDLAEAEAILTEVYASVRLGSSSQDAPTRVRIARSSLGSFDVDDVNYAFDFRYEADPLEQIMLIRLREGKFCARQPSDETVMCRPGEAVALAANADEPVAGRGDQARYEILNINRRHLDAVAANATSRGTSPVQLTGQAVVSPAANQLLVSAIDHVCAIVHAHDAIPVDSLLAGGVQRYLASVMLHAFPNTALFEPTVQDRCDSGPTLLRRAATFIDENAHRDISLSDIAAAVYVSPRAVQYMFRRHLDCTPTDYIRKTRLSYAHDDLIGGNRLTTSVAAIARKWGFSNAGRFAAAYRRTYGQSPHITLQA